MTKTKFKYFSKHIITVGAAEWEHLVNGIKWNQIYQSQISLLHLMYDLVPQFSTWGTRNPRGT